MVHHMRCNMRYEAGVLLLRHLRLEYSFRTTDGIALDTRADKIFEKRAHATIPKGLKLDLKSVNV